MEVADARRVGMSGSRVITAPLYLRGGMCLGVVSSPLLAAAARLAISLCQRTEWLRQCSGVGGAHAVAKAEEVDGGGVTGEGCGPAGPDPLSPPLWLLPLLQGEPKSHDAAVP